MILINPFRVIQPVMNTCELYKYFYKLCNTLIFNYLEICLKIFPQAQKTIKQIWYLNLKLKKIQKAK